MGDTVTVAGDLLPNEGTLSWDRPGLRPSISAFDGQIGAGTIDVRDDATVEYVGGRRVTVVFDDGGGGESVVIDGFIGEQVRSRPDDDAAAGHRINSYTLQDNNLLLAHRRIGRWKRPAESDRARVLAAMAAFCPDVDTTDFVPNTNLVTMPRKTYEDTFLDEVFADALELTGKTWFADNARRLHYHKLREDVGFNAAVSIVADGAADGETTFAPVGLRRRMDPYELTNDLRVVGEKGNVVTVTDSGSIAAHDADDVVHQDVLQYSDANDTATLTAYGEAVLDERKDELKGWTCRLENLPDPSVLEAGMLIAITGEVSGLSGDYQRISQLSWETPAPGIWHADLDLGSPRRLAKRRVRRPKGNKQGEVVDDASVGLDQFCMQAKRNIIDHQAGIPIIKNVPQPDEVAYDAAPPGHTTCLEETPYFRRIYTAADCGGFSGGWSATVREEQWFEFDPGDLVGVAAVRFAYTVSDLRFETGKSLEYGYRPAGDGPPPREFAYEALGTCSPAGGTFDIPASVLTPSTTNYVVLACADLSLRGVETCDDALLQPLHGGPLGDPPTWVGGGEFGSWQVDIDTVSAVTRVVSGSGLTPWTSMIGDIDGVNVEYELPDWTGRGVPRVRIGGIEYAAGHDFDYDEDAGTITMSFAPWPGAPLQGRWLT